MKTELRLSVRTLIQTVLCSGDLESRFTGPARAAEGIQIHQRIQGERPDDYVREVGISRDFETQDFIFTITGRIDGIYQYPGRVVIDEIKTTHEGLRNRERKEDTRAWAQVKCYAYLYSLEHGLEEIGCQLTLCQVGTGEIEEARRSYSRIDLESFFQDLLGRYAEWAKIVEEWGRTRDRSIDDLEFPFDRYRPGQREMSAEVFRAVRQADQLMVRAATGIGKTMAALFPSIKAMGEGFTSRIFYLTAKTTARSAAEHTLDELRAKGLKLKSINLTAKEKICFRPGVACSGEECEFAGGYFDRIQEAVKYAFMQEDAFTRAFIEAVGKDHNVCPFELSLDLALWADCIICDYNYVFDPRVFLKRFFQDRHTDYTLLIDEAHNLEDRSREMFSAEIFKRPFLELRRLLKDDLPGIHNRMGRVNSWLVRARKRCDEAGGPVSEKERIHELYPHLKRFAAETERWLSLNTPAPYRERLLDFYFDVTGFLKISEQVDECYAAFGEKTGRDLRVKLFCMDPSRQLNGILKRFRSAVFFSATMTPADYYKRILGCEDSAGICEFSSPFPRENLCVMLAGSISTYYRHRGRTRGDVATAIQSVVRGKKGNYLLFFPSYEYMMMIHALFAAENPGVKTIIQSPGMAEEERDLFLGRFTRENSDTLVGFVVMGGIFGEGIDLVGERLSGAVIVGVGLPGISAERELIRSYFDERGEEGFAYAYAYPGMNRVLQAAGRVIRSDEDRGVILLADKRFLTHEYQSLFAEEWDPVVVQGGEHIREVLKGFWGDDGCRNSGT